MLPSGTIDLDDLAKKAAATGTPMPPTTVYEHGPFIDLCKGPHVASTGRIGPFKLLAVAGAYWRGDAARPMLQRVYGTVWATQEELDRRDEKTGKLLITGGKTCPACRA